MTAIRATLRSRLWFLVAAGLLVAAAIVAGTRLAPAIGNDLAFLPAVAGLLGCAAGFVAKRPWTVLGGTVIGIIAGALATPAYFSSLSSWWN